ncbi:hypothetical protein [Flavobacterium phragmitis]|uniref:Uncharacterized protein n=1 Tax=Flavobacterium phragmitis TaxID=739143 RepID=A0A1I1PQ13_9FLAO|nr:hypothetical protein [Flavobacterium phragmitis]SFD09083.1 hypothetical protein SAMN05216297_104150 [Flavobacterium phragmitis]
MEPNNFEKDFREKLDERRIEPSNKAWDRLDAMLSVQEEKKQPSKKKWLYIAASFIGFLLIGTLFFNQNKNAVETPKTVIVEKEIEKESVKDPILNTEDSVKTEVAVSEKPSEVISNKVEKTSNPISNKTSKNESNQIAESSIIKNNQSTINQTVVPENPQKENVDQLLQNAEEKVLAQSGVKKAKVKINANDLLNQVDEELELSFREKVITKVNKNLQEVKVAISNRNQQE